MIRIPVQLGLRPTPYLSESVLGYWVRLALENCIPLPRLMSVLPPQVVDVDCGESKTQLSAWAAQYLRAPQAVNPRWVLANNVRWCPCCLRESEHWRAHWELAMVSCCPVHEIYLRDRCPDCSSPIYWRGLNLAQCHCGLRLSAQKNVIRSKPTVIEKAVLASLYPEQFDNEDFLPSFLKQLNSDQLQRLMLFIGCWDLPKRKPSYKTDIGWVISAAEKVDHTFDKWPSSYFSILDHQLLRHPNEPRLIRQLGFYYRAVYREFQDPEFAFLRDATATYLVESWPGKLDRRYRRIPAADIEKNTNRSQTRLSKDVHVSARFIRRWLHDNKIDGQEFQLPSGRTRVTIPLRESIKIVALSRALNLNQAAVALQLPERRVIELIRSGLLYGASPEAGESWLIPLEEVERVREIVNKIHFLDDGDILTWDQVFRHYITSEVNFGSLISAVVLEQIRVVRPLKSDRISGFADFYVEKNSLKRWIASTASGLALPALQSLLGMKQEVIYHLANTGVLQTKSYGRLGRRVSLEEIQRFKATYITGAELAKEWKTSPRKVEALLWRYGIHPISGPRSDGGRQNIFARTQVNVYCEETSGRRQFKG